MNFSRATLVYALDPVKSRLTRFTGQGVLLSHLTTEYVRWELRGVYPVEKRGSENRTILLIYAQSHLWRGGSMLLCPLFYALESPAIQRGLRLPRVPRGLAPRIGSGAVALKKNDSWVRGLPSGRHRSPALMVATKEIWSLFSIRAPSIHENSKALQLKLLIDIYLGIALERNRTSISSSAILRPACRCHCPREESNLYFKLRKLASYPLNDEGTGNGGQAYPLFAQRRIRRWAETTRASF